MKKKIILAGGTGFLGRSIVKYLGADKYEFIVLTRKITNSIPGAREVKWDGKNLGGWAEELEGSGAVVNLAGKSVNCRYTEANKKEIIESRVFSTGVLGTAILQLKNPPKVWINSSSATLYRYSEDQNMDEYSTEFSEGFSAGVVKAWEKSFNDITTPATAKFILRISIVLGKEDGVMPRLKNLVRFGLGGKQGSGTQFVSWVHAEDFAHIIEWCIDNPAQQGVYNCCVPNPVTNSFLMRSMRSTMNMPLGLPATEWMLAIGALLIGTETELILKSRRVVPAKLLQKGFVFKYPVIGAALKEILA